MAGTATLTPKTETQNNIPDLETIMEAVERANSGCDDPGFCLACGEEQDGCEPDMRGGECEGCGAHKVYGAEEILFHIV